MRNAMHNTGFAAPADHALGGGRRNAVYAELIATAALMLCTIVAAIVVTAGIAHADVGAGVIDSDATVFAIALMLGLVFIGIGGLTGFTLLPRGDRRHRH